MPKPIALCVSADAYVEQSTDSVIRMWSMLAQLAVRVSATMLVMPGWAPLPKIDDSPRLQASSMRARSSGSSLVPLIQPAVVQTLMPDSSSRTSSSVDDQSGL